MLPVSVGLTDSSGAAERVYVTRRSPLRRPETSAATKNASTLLTPERVSHATWRSQEQVADVASLARRMDPQSAVERSYSVQKRAKREVQGSNGASKSTELVATHRRRWREATAPLLPSDYDVILDSLASTPSSGSPVALPTPPRDAQDNHPFRVSASCTERISVVRVGVSPRRRHEERSSKSNQSLSASTPPSAMMLVDAATHFYRVTSALPETTSDASAPLGDAYHDDIVEHSGSRGVGVDDAATQTPRRSQPEYRRDEEHQEAADHQRSAPQQELNHAEGSSSSPSSRPLINFTLVTPSMDLDEGSCRSQQAADGSQNPSSGSEGHLRNKSVSSPTHSMVFGAHPPDLGVHQGVSGANAAHAASITVSMPTSVLSPARPLPGTLTAFQVSSTASNSPPSVTNVRAPVPLTSSLSSLVSVPASVVAAHLTNPARTPPDETTPMGAPASTSNTQAGVWKRQPPELSNDSIFSTKQLGESPLLGAATEASLWNEASLAPPLAPPFLRIASDASGGAPSLSASQMASAPVTPASPVADPQHLGSPTVPLSATDVPAAHHDEAKVAAVHEGVPPPVLIRVNVTLEDDDNDAASSMSPAGAPDLVGVIVSPSIPYQQTPHSLETPLRDSGVATVVHPLALRLFSIDNVPGDQHGEAIEGSDGDDDDGDGEDLQACENSSALPVSEMSPKSESQSNNAFYLESHNAAEERTSQREHDRSALDEEEVERMVQQDVHTVSRPAPLRLSFDSHSSSIAAATVAATPKQSSLQEPKPGRDDRSHVDGPLATSRDRRRTLPFSQSHEAMEASDSQDMLHPVVPRGNDEVAATVPLRPLPLEVDGWEASEVQTDAGELLPEPAESSAKALRPLPQHPELQTLKLVDDHMKSLDATSNGDTTIIPPPSSPPLVESAFDVDSSRDAPPDDGEVAQRMNLVSGNEGAQRPQPEASVTSERLLSSPQRPLPDAVLVEEVANGIDRPPSSDVVANSSEAHVMSGGIASPQRPVPDGVLEGGGEVARKIDSGIEGGQRPLSEANEMSGHTTSEARNVAPSDVSQMPSMQFAKRAKAVPLDDALVLYTQTIQQYLATLKRSRNKVPVAASDAIRDALAFATSFRRAIKDELLPKVVSALNGVEPLTVFATEPKWITKRLKHVKTTKDSNDSEDETTTYSRLWQIVADEVAELRNRATGVERQVTANAVLLQQLQALASTSRPSLSSATRVLSPEEMIEAVTSGIDAVVLDTVASQLVTLGEHGRRLEVRFGYLMELQRMFPRGFVPIEVATTTVPAVVERLLVTDRGTVEAGSVFSTQSLFSFVKAAQDVESLLDDQAIAKSTTLDRMWTLREKLVDVSERGGGLDISVSPTGRFSVAPGSTNDVAASFPFLSRVTSQVHLSEADSAEEQIVRLCSETNRHCAGEGTAALDRMQRNPRYASVLSCAQTAAAELQGIVDQFGLAAEKLLSCRAAALWWRRAYSTQSAPQRQKLIAAGFKIVSDHQLSSKATIAKRNELAVRAFVEELTSSALPMVTRSLEEQEQSLKQLLHKREHMRDLLEEEITVVKSMNQVPLVLDPSWTLDLPSTARLTIEERTTRAERLEQASAANQQIARANFLILGNCLLRPAATASEHSSSKEEREAMAALDVVREQQSVLAESLRKCRLRAEAETSDRTSKNAKSSGQSAEDTVTFFEAARTPVVMPRSKAIRLAHKVESLQSVGIVCFVRNVPCLHTDTERSRPGTSAMTARCTLRLAADLAALEFHHPKPLSEVVAATDESMFVDGFPRPVLFHHVDMLLQGATVPLTSSMEVQAMRFILSTSQDGVVEREVLFPNFASFMEWSDVMQFCLKHKHMIPSATLAASFRELATQR